MVSAKTGLSIAGLGVLGIGIYLAFKNADKIGGFFGKAFGDFGNALSNGITRPVADALTNTSEEQIVNTLELQGQVTDVPDPKLDPFGEISDLNKGRLTFAQFLKQEKVAGSISLKTGVFTNKFTSQPLDFTIEKNTGLIHTGAVGLGAKTIQAQQKLSAKFGIPTFDVKGNLSSFAGFTTGKV